MKKFTKMKSWLMLMVFGLMLSAPSAFAGEKEISGSVTSTSDYASCGTGDLGFNLTFVSYDWEWGNDLTLTFPAGFTVNSADAINGAAAVITGQEVYWAMNYTNSSGQTISVDFNVNVSVGGSVGGDQLVAFLVEGDGWGGGPHFFEGNATVNQDPNSDPKLAFNPSSFDLGEWPIDGWQEDFFVEIFNEGSGTAVVNGLELDDPDGVFGVNNPTFPLNLTNCGGSAYAGVNFVGSGVADGVYNAVYVASWGSGKSVTTADVTATAYTAPVGDIAENPFMVTLPHADAGVSTALPMRSNYNTPGTSTNGKDVVYKFTLAEDKEFDVAITNATEAPKVAIYADGFEGFGGPGVGNAIVSGGATLTDIPLFAGTYYLVVSCEADDAAMTFDINIDETTMPAAVCAGNEYPADAAAEIASNGIVLTWDYGLYTQEYQLMFGTVYPPDEMLMDWTAIDGATSGSYALPNLDPSMQYFWQINVRNNNETTECDIWGFTTTLTPPSNLTASVFEVFEDEYNVNLSWTASNKALLSYNVYRDGGMIGSTTVGTTTFTDYDLAYNMNPCYEYTVEAIFDEGVSAMSNTASACITGVGTVEGLVTELLTGNPINGAEVMIGGYPFTTGFNGRYSGQVLEGTYDYVVVANGYIGETRTSITVDYNTTVTEDFQLDEFPFPVNSVVAVATDNDESVDVYWNSPGVSGGGGGIIDENFTGGIPSWFIGDAPEADWHVDNDMLTLTTGGTNVWRSGYKNDVYTDLIYQVSQQRNGGSEGGSMGIYVRGNGFANMNPGSGANGNMFCWTTNGYWWTGTLTNGDLPDWSGWATTPATVQGLGQENIISAEVIGTSAIFFINGTEITTVATLEAEGFVGGFAHEGTVGSEMAFDYWQIIPGGMGKNAIVNNETPALGKGSIENCISNMSVSTNSTVRGLDYDTRPLKGAKELSGYMIYRQDCAGNDPMEFLGMTLDTTFRDNTWGIADWGMYRWAVEAVYTNNNSAAEYSNCLDKDMYAAIGVEVTTNSGDSPLGTYVLFTNISEPELELFYEVELDETGMYSWPSFRKGVYNIFAHLGGFGDVVIDGYSIEEDEVFVWQLEELLAPPTDLYVTPTGFATWGGGGEIPWEPSFEGFESGDFSQYDWQFGAFGWNVVAEPYEGDYSSKSADIDNSQTAVMEIDYTLEDDGVLSFYYKVSSEGNWDYLEFYINGAMQDDWSGTIGWTQATYDLAAGDYTFSWQYAKDGSVSSGEDCAWVDNILFDAPAGKYSNKEFQLFKVFHDGVFSNETDTTFYQYGTNEVVDILVPGETYNACVSALYSTGLSAQTCYEWTYLPCDSFPTYSTYDAYNIDGSDDNLVVWTDAAYFTPIEEDFEGGLPEGWTMTTNSSVGWFFTTNGSSAFWAVPAGDGTYACANDDAANDDGAVDYLMTPSMNFNGVASITLSFSSFFDGAYGQTGTVEVSIDGGGSWTVVHDIAVNAAWANTEVDLSAYIGNGDVMVAFHANDNGGWASGWAVDNVSIAPSKAGKANSVVIGANIYRDGEMIAYVAEPDTFYLDMNLEPGYYDYCLTKVFSEDDGLHTWESCMDASCVDDVLVPEDCLAPENLTAEDLLGDGYTATLNWEAPNGFDPVWLQYDDGVNVDAIGGPAEFSYAVKWDPSQLADFDGTAATKVNFFPREAGTSFTLKVWKGANAGTLLLEQPLTGLTFDDWNEITFDTPIDIDITEQLWVGFYVVTGGYPAGCGNAVGEANSDLITLDGTTWEHLSDYGLPYSWNIAVYVESAKGESVALPTLVDHATYSSPDATYAAGNLPTSPNAVNPLAGVTELLGYNVYRDGTQVNDEPVIGTYYADVTGVAGYFCYEVTAVYSICGESLPTNEACVDVAIGVNELENNISVYPNPAQDFVVVEASMDIRSIEITNYMGQVVNSVKEVETTQIRIETSSLSAGIYFVEVETEAGIETVRIIISK